MTKAPWIVAIAVLASGVGFAAEAAPPNIVLVLADDLGWTGLGCYGSDLHETPRLDALAAEGMKFTDAYSACTVCSPTRASLMTGKYPARLHLTDFIAGQNRPFEKMTIPEWTKFLRLEEVTIAEALRAAGYATAHVGKWHLSPRTPPAGGTAEAYLPTAHGFDTSVEKPQGCKGYFLPDDFPRADGSHGGYLTDYLTEEAVAAVERMKGGPFFLYLAYHVPHTPIQGKDALVEYYRRKLEKLPDARHRNPTYAAMIHSLDEGVGRVLDALQRLRLTERTLVIFVSDNGGLTQRYGVNDGIADNWPLRRGKGSAFEGGVRVPMIARWPGVIEPGSVCDEPVMTIDFYRTALDTAEAPGNPAHNANLDGVSLLPLFRNAEAQLDRDALYWHYPHYHAGGDAPYSSIRSGPWRLIEFHDDTPALLFDLSEDLGEQRDRSADSPEVLDRLQRRLRRWRAAVDAQMPTTNPDYDPRRAGRPAPRKR